MTMRTWRAKVRVRVKGFSREEAQDAQEYFQILASRSSRERWPSSDEGEDFCDSCAFLRPKKHPYCRVS
jgi:hypothetical protein